MKNSAVISGYANKVVSLGENFGFQIAYSVKKDAEYKNVWVSARSIKGTKIEEGKRYIFEGFISGDAWTSEDGKERNKPVLIISKATEMVSGDKSRNEFVFTGKAIQLKTLPNGNIVGSLAYNVTLADKTEKPAYYQFIAQKKVEVAAGEVEVKGFFTGDVYVDKETGKDRNKTKLFVQECKPA